jgi:aryl-alcohol dehydrogenase-like predicted oxidoreductase
MALGSWRTLERISDDDGLSVMLAARDAGVTLLDDARYDDETGTAPMPSGWSEVVFGELFRRAGWDRAAVTVCNKLWWEHWPDEAATAELDGSLDRMGLEHVDVIYSIAAATAPAVEVVVEQVDALIRSGRARAWGTGMWSGQQLHAALDVCDATGAPYPIAAQMACSLAEHSQADDPAVLSALERGGIGLVAAYVLAGGTLTGKYAAGATGRAGDDISPVAVRGKQISLRLATLAAEWDVHTAHLAFAYAFDHPHVATVLFGATSVDQVKANVAAITTYESLDETQRARITALA